MSERMAVLIEYDPEADAIYARVQQPQGTVRGDRIDERRTVMYDDRREVVGVELLFVSAGIDLQGIPHADEIADALRSFPRLVA